MGFSFETTESQSRCSVLRLGVSTSFVLGMLLRPRFVFRPSRGPIATPYFFVAALGGQPGRGPASARFSRPDSNPGRCRSNDVRAGGSCEGETSEDSREGLPSRGAEKEHLSLKLEKLLVASMGLRSAGSQYMHGRYQ